MDPGFTDDVRVMNLGRGVYILIAPFKCLDCSDSDSYG
jgi:hypothetical protein